MTASGAATATLLLGDVFPGKVVGQDAAVKVGVTKLPRKQIAQVSKLGDGQPLSFNYPGDGDLANCLIVKTGETSGGGVGDAQDIVAFSARCTHMGGDLDGLYNVEHKVAGPCGEHLTTFDLTRHTSWICDFAVVRQDAPYILSLESFFGVSSSIRPKRQPERSR